MRAPRPKEQTIALDVRRGLVDAARKHLPPRLFYDEEGSRLFEVIAELPEYYPTRLERTILTTHADEIAEAATAGTAHRVHVVELGAGTATKSQLILSALVRRQGRTLYLPIDVSDSALREAQDRLARELPGVQVRPLAVRHEEALAEVQRVGPRRLVLFIGSSIGNFGDEEAVTLLRCVRGSLALGGALLLGADRRKAVDVMLAAYDDKAGVTAAFNKNVLVRINRELSAQFDLDAFAHRAIWNEEASAVEMHLESQRDQRVRVRSLGVTVQLARGETIHTESSVKYDDAHLERITQAAGFVRERDFFDDDRWYGVHLFRAV